MIIPDTNQKDRFREARETMVRVQIMDRGIKDEAILKAMMKVPRHLFVPDRIY